MPDPRILRQVRKESQKEVVEAIIDIICEMTNDPDTKERSAYAVLMDLEDKIREKFPEE